MSGGTTDEIARIRKEAVMADQPKDSGAVVITLSYDTADVPAGIRTERLPNAGLEPYRYADPLDTCRH
jgi:hypothetical protein